MSPRSAHGLAMLFSLLVAMGGSVAMAKTDPVIQQLEFGVEMAKRGLWSEALFRFKQAEKLTPGSTRVLNNMAVAYEALGQFDRALEYYQQAVQAGGNTETRQNYSRFVEFYRNFKPEGEEEDDEEDATASADSSSTEPATDQSSDQPTS